KGQPLALAAREVTRMALLEAGEADLGERLACAPPVAADPQRDLVDGALGDQVTAGVLREVRRATLPLDDPTGRGQKPRGQLRHRGLAGPVWTGQHRDLATPKLEILVLEHGRFRPVRERRVDKSAHTRRGV